nr:DUF6444 domain-containing protein [Parafrankia sp. EUN1f]
MLEQAGLIAQLRAALEQARARIAELEAQVAKTSRNSGKPPSSDGLAQPPPKSSRKKTGRRQGGKPGHPGATLCLLDDPDVRLRHEAGPCSGCGSSLGVGRWPGLNAGRCSTLVGWPGGAIPPGHPTRGRISSRNRG